MVLWSYKSQSAKMNFPLAYMIYAFNFIRWCRHTLLLWSRGGGRTKQRSALEDGQKLAAEGTEGMFMEDILMLGYRTLAHMNQVAGVIHLHVWEVMLGCYCVQIMVLAWDHSCIVGSVIHWGIVS